MKPSQINRKMKSGFDASGMGAHTHSHGVAGNTHSHNNGVFQEVADADFAFTFRTGDGNLKVIKDRTGEIIFDDRAPAWYAIKKFSFIISRMLFKENNIKMFQEGLNQEIQKAINTTIKKYHERRC